MGFIRFGLSGLGMVGWAWLSLRGYEQRGPIFFTKNVQVIIIINRKLSQAHYTLGFAILFGQINN